MPKTRDTRLTWRLWAVALVLGISAAGLVGRLAYLQVVAHPAYAARAKGAHLEQRILPAHRGALLDRNGFPLATSVETWDIAVDRRVWQDKEGKPNPAMASRVAEKLAPLLGTTAPELLARVNAEKGNTVSLARLVDYDAGRKIIDLALPGILIEATSRRIYPEGDAAAQLLGFMGREPEGHTGLEHDLHEALTGKNGVLLVERDVHGDAIPFGNRREEPPTAGRDVVLALDRTIQRMIERELDDGIKRTGARGGTIIVQDPKTGAILGMTSRPSFKRESLDLSDPRQVELVRNRVVTDQYEPGSVFKLATMAAALNEGKVNPNTTYLDTGEIVVGERSFKNWDLSANGTTTMTTVLVRSLNTGTVWVADKLLGASLFYQYVKAFGFGAPTGVGLAGETGGAYRLPADDGWYRADLASNSFGQGISVTPLQVVNMVSALANGGMLMRPYVVQETRGAEGAETTEPRPLRRVVSDSTARQMAGIMREVVDANIYARVPGYSAAGKSGTAYVPTVSTTAKGDAYAEEVTIPSYVGFAPVDNPRITILVKLDHLKSADFGGVLTAPMYARLTRDILTYLRVPPDRPETVGQPVRTQANPER